MSRPHPDHHRNVHIVLFHAQAILPAAGATCSVHGPGGRDALSSLSGGVGDDLEDANNDVGHDLSEDVGAHASQVCSSGFSNYHDSDFAEPDRRAAAGSDSAVRAEGLLGTTSRVNTGAQPAERPAVVPAPALRSGRRSLLSTSSPETQPSVSAVQNPRQALSAPSQRQENTISAATQPAGALLTASQQGDGPAEPPGKGAKSEIVRSAPDSHFSGKDATRSKTALTVPRAASAPSPQSSLLRRISRRSEKTPAEGRANSDDDGLDAAGAQESSDWPLLPGAQLSLSGESLRHDATCAPKLCSVQHGLA